MIRVPKEDFAGMLRPAIGKATLFLLAVFVCGTAAGSDWPSFRGPGHDGAVDGTPLDEATALQVRWIRELGAGYSAVSVAGDLVVTMYADGDGDFLGAFCAESGEERWRYRIGDTHKGHDGSHDGPISTPLIAGGRVYGLGPWGQLFCVDAADGRELWSTHLVDDHGGQKPFYGFTTAPLLADGVLVVLLGGEGERAVAGFDPADGRLVWALGEDEISYQSPVLAEIAGRRQVIAAGKTKVWGIDAATGNALWRFEHGGDDRAMGGHTIVPLPVGDDRVFLMNKLESSVMVAVKVQGDAFEVSELWTTDGIKRSYVPAVHHDGRIFGMANRIFSCIDATSGQTLWRSREPGDGFPIVVGDRLVIMTKPGTLHLARTSAEGYDEQARLDLFDDHSWSEVAYADGHLYARSMSQLARIDFVRGETTAAAADPEPTVGSEFEAFLAAVADATDKARLVDEFIERQPGLPVVEETGDVHFLYRGPAADVGIVGDMIGFRREDPMTRVAGTDLFYYSTRLEPDAAVSYGFIPDYGEPVPDPLNPEGSSGLFGEVSWLAMPAWSPADYLEEAPADRRGTREDLEWASEAYGGRTRKAGVYLPAGYGADPSRRYPTVYVHGGDDALTKGRMQHALDNLLGRTVEPLIAVFILPEEGETPPAEDAAGGYVKMVADELVPAVDSRYRTRTSPNSRASFGAGSGANAALEAALKRPDVFRRVASQSATMMLGQEYGRMLPGGTPLVIYLEWGTYHLRSPHEAWDMARGNRELWQILREQGYRPAGGEIPQGFGWRCWSSRTHAALGSIFPLRRRPAAS